MAGGKHLICGWTFLLLWSMFTFKTFSLNIFLREITKIYTLIPNWLCILIFPVCHNIKPPNGVVKMASGSQVQVLFCKDFIMREYILNMVAPVGHTLTLEVLKPCSSRWASRFNLFSNESSWQLFEVFMDTNRYSPPIKKKAFLPCEHSYYIPTPLAHCYIEGHWVLRSSLYVMSDRLDSEKESHIEQEQKW